MAVMLIMLRSGGGGQSERASVGTSVHGGLSVVAVMLKVGQAGQPVRPNAFRNQRPALEHDGRHAGCWMERGASRSERLPESASMVG